MTRRGVVFVFGRPGAGSFNAAAAAALERLAPRLAAESARVDLLWRQTFDLPTRIETIAAVLSNDRPDLVLVHGGQGDAPIAQLAPAFPQVRFVVTQGSVVGPNVASYGVRQEDSAFLAGVFAARFSRTGRVAHLSGERVRPGLLGRSAYVAGVQHAVPGMQVLTGFCGDQHDPALARRWSLAMFDRGADVLFTMLDGGRPGAIAACRERGTFIIGNVEDWTLREPEVCVASAIADSGWGVEQAITDWLDDRFPAGHRLSVGAERPGVIRLAMSAQYSAVHGEAIAARVAALVAQPESFSPDYGGPEFSPDQAV
jgi:basic membrane protein A and related proteins